MKIGFIGCGKLGSNLAWSLNRAGYCVTALSSRDREGAARICRMISGCQFFDCNQQVADEADLVFLTVPDEVIRTVSDSILWKDGQYVLHCSGLHTTNILDKASADGAQVGVFHPLQSFTSFSKSYDYFKGIAIAVEARDGLRSTMQRMGTQLGGTVIAVPENFKALYHTSAVLAANYLVVLVEIASRLWKKWGIAQEDAVRFLLPLVRGCVSNIETNGIKRSLTGPVSRGDIGTIVQNMAALNQHAPEFQHLYRELGLQAASMACANHYIPKETAAELKNILEIPAVQRGQSK